MVYGTYNYSIHGVYKPIYNWGGLTLYKPVEIQQNDVISSQRLERRRHKFSLRSGSPLF